MKNNLSKNHHYLPRFYLKGFTDSNNSFYVYDKQKDTIFYANPNTTFFEKDLNTVILPDGSTSDFLEELYAGIEKRCLSSFYTIRKSSSKTPIKPFDKMSLFLFLLFLYWRLPSNIEFTEQLAKKALRDNSEFDYFKLRSKNGQEAPSDIVEEFRNSPAFKKVFKQIIPFFPFFKDKDWATKLDNWRFLYTGDEKSWHMVGDDPIIIQPTNEHDFVNCLKEFIFPISGRILLINTDRPIEYNLTPQFTIDYNAAMLHRAQRFIAYHNEDFLKAIIKYYKDVYIKFGKTDLTVPAMFEALKIQQK